MMELWQGEADAFALMMLAMILLSMGVIVMLLVCMARNAGRRDKGVDELLDELERDQGPVRKPDPKKGEKREDWEKDGDWWK
ncbi:MAG: hypothetical protein ACSHX7_04905 [Luteolibacter sp.]